MPVRRWIARAGRGSACVGTVPWLDANPSRAGARWGLRRLRECAHAGDVASEQQRLHALGALVRVDGLDVGHVLHDAVLQQDAVSAEERSEEHTSELQ